MRALPDGYMPALAGVVIFGIGGGADFVWHDLFGFEEGVEPLLSPSHLALAAGAFLFITAPLRAAWRRPDSAGWRALLPAMLSLLHLLSLLTFFTQYAHFLTAPDMLVFQPSRDQYLRDIAGVTGILLPTALMMGVTLWAMRRWRLPTGSLTLIFTINAALMFGMRIGDTRAYPLLMLVPLIGGALADWLIWRHNPSADRAVVLRLFAFVVPFVMFLAYMILLHLSSVYGIWWQIHMWLGVPFLAGIAGLFLSYLVAPPPVPPEAA